MKKIEKLPNVLAVIPVNDISPAGNVQYALSEIGGSELRDKINEIIDLLNHLQEKEKVE